MWVNYLTLGKTVLAMLIVAFTLDTRLLSKKSNLWTGGCSKKLDNIHKLFLLVKLL